jgi:Sap-like sulfolipid-1-addressing protein
MGGAIGDVLPLAVGIAISPVPIIAVILMLFTPRARSNGPAFLAGWVIGVALVVSISYSLADAGEVASSSSANDTMSQIKIVLGVLLILMVFRKRRAAHEAALLAAAGGNALAPSMPRWMTGLEGFNAMKAFTIALVLAAVNPKNLALGIAAGAAIAQANTSGSDAWLTILVFVLIASASVAVPVLYFLVAGASAQRVLDGWKTWLVANNQTVMGVLFLVFGAVLIGKGISGLSA